jgi:uncharacterized membrane protein SirB2
VNELVLRLARWVEAQPFSVGLHESFYMYNWIETTHVLTLMVSLGMLAVIDLRMLGVLLPDVPASTIARRLNKPMLIGFGIMFVTGIALYSAIPVRTTQSLWFRIKFVLLLAALVNAVLFHRHMRRSIDSWDTARIPPARTRVAAGLSLALWAGVIVTGRFIAYDWFDCGEPNPAWIDAVIGCTKAVAAL